MSSKNSKFGFENKNEIEGEFKAAKFAVNQKKNKFATYSKFYLSGTSVLKCYKCRRTYRS